MIIEDDTATAQRLVRVLAGAGFSCYVAADGEHGVAAIREHDPLLITLDIDLPGMDGFEVVRRLRTFTSAYVMMISDRTAEVDVLTGLEAGADDYLAKPIRPRELRARVQAMLRRRYQFANPRRTPAVVGADPLPTPDDDADEVGKAGWLTHNGLAMHPTMRLAEIDGEPVELTRTEFDLMMAILERRRRVATKNELVHQLRGDRGGNVDDKDRRSIEVHLGNLRRKLDDSTSRPRFVQTVRGVGYRLAP